MISNLPKQFLKFLPLAGLFLFIEHFAHAPALVSSITSPSIESMGSTTNDRRKSLVLGRDGGCVGGDEACDGELCQAFSRF